MSIHSHHHCFPNMIPVPRCRAENSTSAFRKESHMSFESVGSPQARWSRYYHRPNKDGSDNTSYQKPSVQRMNEARWYQTPQHSKPSLPNTTRNRQTWAVGGDGEGGKIVSSLRNASVGLWSSSFVPPEAPSSTLRATTGLPRPMEDRLPASLDLNWTTHQDAPSPNLLASKRRADAISHVLACAVSCRSTWNSNQTDRQGQSRQDESARCPLIQILAAG